MKKATVTLRFYEELNDHLPTQRRKRDFHLIVKDSPTVEQIIESVGVPAREVDLILVNGTSVSFSHIAQDGDRISVYPVFESFDISKVTKLRERPLRRPTFIVDIGLEKLGEYLQKYKFNTSYGKKYSEEDIIKLSVKEKRTLLTMRRDFLKMSGVMRGYLVKHSDPRKQLKEVIEHFDLYGLTPEDSKQELLSLFGD
ncbi:MAG: Mut7-C RNAse domain-containing protein [bacterium]